MRDEVRRLSYSRRDSTEILASDVIYCAEIFNEEGGNFLDYTVYVPILYFILQKRSVYRDKLAHLSRIISRVIGVKKAGNLAQAEGV